MNYLPKQRRKTRRPSFERLEVRVVLTAEVPFFAPSILPTSRIGFIPSEPAELTSQDKAFYNASAVARLEGTLNDPGAEEPAPIADTFFLHSRPNATKTIFIDFDGNTTIGTSWNFVNDVTTIVSPAYDPDGNGAAFTSNELLRIQRIWQRVAEDFAPFDVNVTTEDPGQAALVKSGGSETQWGIRVVVTSNNFYPGSVGGVAYIGSFNWGLESSGATDTPAWVFNASEIGVSGAVSHEAGHTLGLSHDGTTASNPVQPSQVYYNGHGSGETSWGPIMGSGYYKNVTTWDQGEYFGSSNTGSSANYDRGPSDVAVISTYNGFGVRPDDHGNTRATATTVNYDTPDPNTGLVGVSLFGVVDASSDIDFVRFDTAGGVVNLTIDPYVSEIWRSDGTGDFTRSLESSYFNSSSWQNNQGSNLDVEAKLYDDSGTLIATSNPTGLRATFTDQSLPAGTYYISIDGVGFGDPTSSTSPTGYTDYGSLGQYLVSGTVVSPGLRVRPVAVNADRPEGNAGTTPFEFAVTLSEVQATAVTVDWGVAGSGSSPVDSSDFGGSFPAGTVTIPAGELSAPVIFNVFGDTEFEPDETFALELANLSLGTAIAGDLGTIRNDDRAPILLVDDDQGSGFEVFYQDALNANGYQFETWDVSASLLPDTSVLNLYDAVIWNTGNDHFAADAGLSATEQQSLMVYLDSGGRLFLSGQDILYNGVTPEFRQDYLKVASYTNDVISTAHIENGIAGNAIGSDLSLSISSPTDFGSLWVDALTPTSEGSGVFLLPSANADPYTAVSFRGNYSEGGFGIVFFTVPFESISVVDASPNNQATVMQRVIEFLLSPVVNTPPVITANSSAVSGVEGAPIHNAGLWSDIDLPADTVVLSASLGSVTKNANGTWDWEVTVGNETNVTNVVVTADDGAGGVSTTTFTFLATNVAPTLTVGDVSVAGDVLSEITNHGTWNDVAADNVTLTASSGSLTSLPDGTWSWSITSSSKMDDVDVVITASDGVDSSMLVFKVSAHVNVTNSQVYYKGSAYAQGGTNVAAALDPSKVIAHSGSQPQTLSYANMINTTRGINGIVLDVAGLVGTTLTTADFFFRMSPQGLFNEAANPPNSWPTAPTPSGIFVTPGNATTPARVRLEWPDNAIENRWLQFQILATANTGLASTEVYYLGHLKGELDGQLIAGAYFVMNADLAAIMPLGGGATSVDNIKDIDKDRYLMNADRAIVRDGVVAGLKLHIITIPVSGSAVEGVNNPGGAELELNKSWALPPPNLMTLPVQSFSSAPLVSEYLVSEPSGRVRTHSRFVTRLAPKTEAPLTPTRSGYPTLKLTNEKLAATVDELFSDSAQLSEILDVFRFNVHV